MLECKPCFDKMMLIGVCLFVAAVVLVILQCCSFSYLFKYKGVKGKYYNSFLLRENIHALADNVLVYNEARDFFDFYHKHKLLDKDRPYFEAIMLYAAEKYNNPFCMLALGMLHEDEQGKAVFWYRKALENASGLSPDEQKYCEEKIRKMTQN